jgi:hypothetical protein
MHFPCEPQPVGFKVSSPRAWPRECGFPLAPVTGTRGQAAAVRAERRAQDIPDVAAKGNLDSLLIRWHVPQPHGLVQTDGSQAAAVRAERQAEDAHRVRQRAPRFPCRHIPEVHVPVAAVRRGQNSAVGAERHGPDDALVPAAQGQPLPGGHFPDTKRVRFPSGAGQEFSVRTERHAQHRMALCRDVTVPRLPRDWIPELDRPVMVGGGQGAAVRVRAEGHAKNRAGPAAERADFLTRARVPDPRGLIPAGGGDAPAVRAEGHVREGGLVPAQGKLLLAGGGVPDLPRLVPANGGEAPAVGAEGHPDDIVGVPAEDQGLPVRAATLQGRAVRDLEDATGGATPGAPGEPEAIGADRQGLDPSAEDAQLERFLSRCQVPELKGAIIAGRSKSPVVGQEREFDHLPHMGLQSVDLLPGFGLPNLDRPVLAPQGYEPAVAAERRRKDPLDVPLERRNRLAGGHVMHLDGSLHARCQEAAVAAEGEPVPRDHLLGEGAEQPAGRSVPEAHVIVQAGGGQGAAVRAERQGDHSARVTREVPKQLAGLEVPDFHHTRFVLAAHREEPAIGAERQAPDESPVPGEGVDVCSRLGVPDLDDPIETS